MASAGASGHSTVAPSCNRLLQKKWDERTFQSHKERVCHMLYNYMNIRIELFNVTICLTSYGPWNHQWTTWPQETLCISSKTWESNGYVHVLSYPMSSLYYLCTFSRWRRIVWASLTTTTVNYCRACTTLCTPLAVLTTATRTGDQRRGVCVQVSV